MRTLLRSCAEVRESIAVSLGVVSGVGTGIHVLDGVHVPQGEEVDFEIVCPHYSVVSMVYSVTEMYSTRA